MKSMIAIGLYVPGTGFTRVLQSIFQYLHASFDIHWIGIGYKGPVLDFCYKVYPNNVDGGDAFGAYFAEELISELNAEVLFVLNDFWILKNYEKLLLNLSTRTKKIAYIPLDGKIIDPQDVKSATFFDEVVLYSKFAYKQTRNAFQHLSRHRQYTILPNLSVILHGVDLSSFHELDHQLSKRLVFSQIPHPTNSIFILNANRPVERKGVHLTIKAFALAFEQFNFPTYLVLHHAGIDSPESRNCRALVEELQIQDHVIFNPLKEEGYVSDEDLNLLYNACDIGVNSSYGEGWGLISFEHGAVGGAQIVPDHTSCRELWQSTGLVAKPKKDVKFETSPFMMCEVDVNDLAQHFIDLVNDDTLRNKIGKNCQTYAKNKKYTWSNISDKWKEIMS